MTFFENQSIYLEFTYVQLSNCRRGGGGRGVISWAGGGGKGLNTLEQEGWGWELGGGGEPYPASLCPGAQKSKFPRGGRVAPIQGVGEALAPKKKIQIWPLIRAFLTLGGGARAPAPPLFCASASDTAPISNEFTIYIHSIVEIR